MGASEWDYVEPFDTDLPTTLANLRRRVFDGRDYFWHESIPRPGTLADLDGLFTEIIETLSPGEIDYDDPRIIQLADIASSGTHSILDMRTVGDRGPITVLPRGEAEALFGAAKPSRADLERVGKGKWIEIESRWTGVCVPFHDESGTVTEVAFWGCSGD